MMGFSFDLIESPAQCFNPAKSWQLGWYEQETITVNPFLPQGFQGTLKGITDFKFGETPNEYVIIKIPDTNGEDLYVGYNRKKSINRETQAQPDKILVVRSGEGYAQSDRVANIGLNDSYTQSNYFNSGKQLCVVFKDRSLFFDKATIEIRVIEEDETCKAT
jgi:hypothetical protein